RVYRVAPQDLEVREHDRSMAVRATGFPDTVVWNPGITARSLTDLEPGGETRMLCVEAAAAATPVVLAAGARWRGSQMLTAG
ncbi:MAG: D-hexose-6-phosphate mutarotase, partial [Xanthomonadales bacterium]|nr:D-hexose-6-phosphate mutarotase [Xanthomonadales bacterium]